MNRSMRWVAAGVVGVIGAVHLHSTALADSFYPAKVEMEVGSWRFTPILRQESVTSDTVQSLLAWKKTSEGPDSTIQAVWYIRSTSEPCQWDAKAWEAATPYDAMLAVKTSLDIDSRFDDDWPISLSGGVMDSSKVGVEYSKGFFGGDTMAEFVNALPGAERDDAVSFLVEVGYAAADVPIEKKTGSETIDPASALNAMTYLIEFVASQPPAPEPNHVVPSIPTPVPATWPGFPPGTTIPGTPSQFCQYWFGSGCFTVYFGWGPWNRG